MANPNLLIIGAGGVGAVALHKAVEFRSHFGTITLASRTLSKVQSVVDAVKKRTGFDAIGMAQVNARDEAAVIELINAHKTDILLNLALPYCNEALLDAAIKTGTHYLDTAVAEAEHVENMAAPWYCHVEWPRAEACEKAGITALLGIGFDPGTVNVFCSYAQKHHFDRIDEIDIIDVNGGDHGRYFATNFDPDTNLREIKEDVLFWEDGEFQRIDHHSKSIDVTLPRVGTHRVYSMGHDEIHSLPRTFKDAKRIEFWMGFGDHYLKVFNVLNELGLTSSIPVDVEGHKIAPIKMLKAVLPDPASLAAGYSGEVCIGCDIRGTKDGQAKRLFVYSNCDHRACYEEVGSQAISYTTAIPAIAAAILIADGQWNAKKMVHCEELDPDPFLEMMTKVGIDWTVSDLPLDGSWPSLDV